MKVKKARAAELSDYEVLSVLREMDRRQQKAQANAPAATDGVSSLLSVEERALQALPPNLRTIQYEVLETLQNVQRPCAHQSAEQIPRFLDALSAWERGRPVEGVAGLSDDFDAALQFGNNDQAGAPMSDNISIPRAAIEPERRLTKGERLMLVNHAPTSAIELFTIVEELEDRFSQSQIADLRAIIAAYLPLDLEAMQAQPEPDGDDAEAVDIDDAAEQPYDEEQQQHPHEEVQHNDDIVDMDEEMELMENERRGSPAVDDEVPDE